VCEQIDKYLTAINPPRDFNQSNHESILNEIDLSFERLCSSLEEAGVQQPKKMSVFEFNQRVDYYKEKHKKDNVT